MLAPLPTFEKLIQAFLARLRDAEYQETDLLPRLEACVQACQESLQELKQWVIDNPFPDKATEIYFFKSVKPVVMARYIYYQKVFRLHIAYYKGSGILEKERLTTVLQEIDRFFADNQHFYDYYRIGDTRYDEWYFVRGQHDWKICPGTCHFDDVFSTSVDGKLAELLANEMLLEYVDKLLNQPGRLENGSIRTGPSSTLICTANTTSIVELGYALYAGGFFNHGNASIKDIMNFLSDALQVNLHKYYDTFVQIRERKTNPTKYIDELKNNLAKYIDKTGN